MGLAKLAISVAELHAFSRRLARRFPAYGMNGVRSLKRDDLAADSQSRDRYVVNQSEGVLRR